MRENLKIFRCPKPIGGINDTDNEMSLSPNVLVDLLNMQFDKNDIKTRKGYTAYSTSGLPATSPEWGLYPFKKSNGNEYLLGVFNTAVYAEGTVGVFASVMTGLTAGYPWSWTTLTDFAIGGDGVNKPVKYDGAVCKNLEIVAPTAAPVTVLGAAGNLTGAYQYCVTFVSAKGAEINASPSSTILSPSLQQVNVSNIPTGGTDVSQRKLYRSLAGGSLFYLLATIADNTTTTYTDDTEDVNLGTDLVPDTHDAPPSNGKFPTVYKEFLFMVDPDYPTRLYFSHQSYPEIFYTAEGTGHYMTIGLNDGEDIIGARPLKGSLYVFKERSTYPVLGDTPDDLRTVNQALTSSFGLYHNSMAYVDMGGGEVLAGLSQYGLYIFDGYSYKNIGFQPEADINISALLDGLDEAQLHKAYGFNHIKENQYRLSVMEAGYSYNNKEIVWDYKHNQITIFDIKRNSMIEWNGNVLFGSSQSDGLVHQIGGLNDNGAAIAQTVEFPWWLLGDNEEVIFEQINVDTTLRGSYSPTFNIYVDGTTTAHAVNLASGYTWGSVAWATAEDNYRTKVGLRAVGSDYVNLKGTSLKCRLTHSGLNQPITLSGITVYYASTDKLSGADVDSTVLQLMGV
ncbi:MAG: hypothetical protein NUW09_02575 [Deltaproteobacteria bacterium]|nr:hypothetical protein [Deltaproteobacteria bacterium]